MLENTPTSTVAIIILLIAWELLWKGLALWKAAQLKDKAWFIILLFVNTIGLLPIAYLLLNRQKT